MAAIFLAVLIVIALPNDPKNGGGHHACEDGAMPYGYWIIVNEEGGYAKIDNGGDTRILNPLEFAKLLALKMTKGRIRLHTGEDGSAHGYIIAPHAVVEYDGDDYFRYYLENGKKLMLELLREKKERA